MPDVRASTLRVVQLNMGSLLEPDWERRRVEVLAWFERLEPDVVCLQEAWEDATHPCSAEWLVDNGGPSGAGRWHWCFGGLPLPEPLWADRSLRFGSAILSRWPIDHHELIALPVDVESPDPLRHFESELLHARTAGVDVYSTHLVPAPAHAYHRVRQVLAIDEAITASCDPAASLPLVLCGDFNAEPGSDEMRFLMSQAVVDGRSTYYRDAWAAAGRTDPGVTADPRRNPLCAALNVPPKRIDYVLLGDSFARPHGAGRVLHAALAFDEPLTGILASDHWGLVVDLLWPGRPG
jgi:endonuclease/exonuclease/phosphatase family metal-dependent hydrolase